MPPRKARKPAAEAAPATEPEQSQKEEALAPPATKGRKRSASRSASPMPTTQPTTTDEEPSPSGDSQGSGRTDGSGSVKKRRIAKERSEPTRVSRRALTKASSKALAVKENGGPLPKNSAKAKAAASKKAAAPRAPKVVQPPFNPLPGIPPKVRPARQLFVFGTGDMGQFGLGTDTLDEIKRPRLHAWCDKAVKDGILGDEPGAGLEYVAVGGMHNLVIDEAGRVWSWGINDGAALGRETANQVNPETKEPIEAEEFETVPMVVQKLVDAKFRAVSVAAGDSVSVAISETGELRTWGSFRSSEGVLGFDGQPGSPRFQFSPMLNVHLAKEHFVSAACGADHVVALTTGGRVFSWGDPRQGATGRKVLERHITHGLQPGGLHLRDIVAVASGNWHSFAIDSNGLVYGWGLNTMGQVGVSDPAYLDISEDKSERQLEDHITTPTVLDVLRPENLGNGRRVVQVSGGEHHTLFLLNDGSVFACGRNDSAQLGLSADHPTMQAFQELKALHPDTLECIPYPVQVYFPPTPPEGATGTAADPPLGTYAVASAPAPDGGPRTPIQHISAGTRHNLAVSRDGIVYAWGYGSQYQLGMGEVDQKDVPGRVKSAVMPDYIFESAYAGGQHCLLLARRKAAPPS